MRLYSSRRAGFSFTVQPFFLFTAITKNNAPIMKNAADNIKTKNQSIELEGFAKEQELHIVVTTSSVAKPLILLST